MELRNVTKDVTTDVGYAFGELPDCSVRFVPQSRSEPRCPIARQTHPERRPAVYPLGRGEGARSGIFGNSGSRSLIRIRPDATSRKGIQRDRQRGRAYRRRITGWSSRTSLRPCERQRRSPGSCSGRTRTERPADATAVFSSRLSASWTIR